MTGRNSADDFSRLLKAVRQCRVCEQHLQPRPVLQADPRARILIAGQAPGRRVHESGIPFDDPSGERLRNWMGISTETFYDPAQVAILPMGFCFPGTGKSGDLAPRRECAATWRAELLASLPAVKLTLVIGQYAQKWHLTSPAKNLTETVRNWQQYGPGTIPLPHPSPRNNIWLKQNPWFTSKLLPDLRRAVAAAIQEQQGW